MKARTNSSETNSNNNSLMWLKIEGYKADTNRKSSLNYSDLSWLKSDGAESSTNKSFAGNFFEVEVFFKTLFLM